MVQVEKLRKIGKNPKNFRKNHVFEANIIAQAENFRNLLTWPERAFTCGSFFEILNCLGEIGLEKNSRNFYKCRGMSRFGEKKHRRKGICARLRATGPAAIIDYHHVHLNHITKLLAMTNS